MQGGGCKLSELVFYLFMFHLTMLLVTQTTRCGVNNELGWTWKVPAMPNFRYYPGIYPEGLSKTSNNLSQVTGLLSMVDGDKELLKRTPYTGK